MLCLALHLVGSAKFAIDGVLSKEVGRRKAPHSFSLCVVLCAIVRKEGACACVKHARLHLNPLNTNTTPTPPLYLPTQVLAMPFLERWLYTWIALFFCRMKYYFAWKVRIYFSRFSLLLLYMLLCVDACFDVCSRA